MKRGEKTNIFLATYHMLNAGPRSIFITAFNPITILWDNDEDGDNDEDSHFTDKETEA